MIQFLNLRVNHIEKPLGFLLPHIRLTWEIVATNALDNVGVEISTTKDFSTVVYRQEQLQGENAVTVSLELTPRTRYYWRLYAGNCYSEVEWFETAKLDESWQAEWITVPKALGSDPYLRKQFIVEKELVSARLYACGLGLYEAELNGRRVGDEYLAPGFHAYDFWQQYQTYDITDELIVGKNCIGFLLSDGWFKGRIGFDGGYTNLYGDALQLIAELHLTYADGSTAIIPTDDTWEYAKSPITFSAIYDGEHQDARKHIAGWATANSDNAVWQSVAVLPQTKEQLTPRLSVPVKKMASIIPNILYTPAGETVLDFGQNITGWIEFTVDVPEGTEVSYQVGEILQAGNFYRDNLRTAVAEFRYISDGMKRHVRPYATFFGFRYARITGFPADIKREDFTGVVLYSAIEQTGKIETANPLVNQLVHNTLWSQKGNFLDVPTDCPQRDERLGWTGDAQIFARTASYHMYTPAFYTKFIYDLRKEQHALNGSVPFMVPMLKPADDAGFVTGNGAAAWSDVATILPWVVYEQYGDKALLKAQYPVMKDWVDFVKREDDHSGKKRLWTTRFQFGDWLSLDGPDPASPMGGTDTVLVASIYYYYSATLVAKAAAVLDNETDAAYYARLAQEIKQAIQTEFITQSGRMTEKTQTAYAMLLYFDLVPSQHTERIVTEFKDKLINDGVHLQTGFVGTAYLAEALSKYGLVELAYGLLLNDDYPSWLYAAKQGATTVWERWNSVMPDGSMNPQGMNSLNHYAYGVIAEWMYRYVLGIQADDRQAGFKHFYLRPQPSIQLGSAKGYYHSISGKIKSDWTIEGDYFHWQITIPYGTTATVTVPRASLSDVPYPTAKLVDEGVEVTLSAGDYEFNYTPTKSYQINYSIDMTLEELLTYTDSRKLVFQNPALRGNGLVMQYKQLPFKDFKDLPIVSKHFVTGAYLEELDKQLQQLG